MDVNDQLEVLKAAGGDAALLALATVDLAYGDLDELQRAELKKALAAAAVPHWIDEAVLGELVGSSAEDSKLLLARLRSLRVIEPFPARGPGAVNVHQASRNALRRRLRELDPVSFKSLSTKAREAVRQGSGVAQRVEALYHQFAMDQDAAATEWEALDREVAHPQQLGAIGAALDELNTEGWLAGAGKIAAMLAAGIVRLERGERTGLEGPAREVIALAREADRQIMVGIGQCLLGEALTEKGELKEAADTFRAYLENFTKLSRSDPKWRREVAVAHSKIAHIEQEEGKLDEALRSMQSCSDLIGELLNNDPENHDLEREQAAIHNRVAILLTEMEHPDDALASYRVAEDVYRRLTGSDPSNSNWQEGLARTLRNAGSLQCRQGKHAEALVALEESLDIFASQAGLDPRNTALQSEVAWTKYWIGVNHRGQGLFEKALTAQRENQRIYEHLVDDDPENINFRGELAVAHMSVAIALMDLEKKQEAQIEFLRARDELEHVIKEAPTIVRWQKTLADVKAWLAR